MSAVEVLHAGWATKEGGRVKTWKRRFFVLRTRLAADRLELHPGSADATHVLLYFKSTGQAVGGQPPTGAIPIAPGATVVTEVVRKDKRCVKIHPGADLRAYYLAPEGGGAENAGWIEALTKLAAPANSAELRRTTLGDRPAAAVASMEPPESPAPATAGHTLTAIVSHGEHEGEGEDKMGLRCARLSTLCPDTLASSIDVWRIDFDVRSDQKVEIFASGSFALAAGAGAGAGASAGAGGKGAAGDAIDLFVTHTWYDASFVAAITEQHATTAITPADVFYDMKATGLKKGAHQLMARRIEGMPGNLQDWTVWMDLVCVNQFLAGHKLQVTQNLEAYVIGASAMVVLLSPDYFTRLWCVYELCCFFAHHPVTAATAYTWGFADALGAKAASEQQTEASAAGMERLIASVRSFTVKTSGCKYEADRIFLLRKVGEFYKSVEAFERFARWSGIAIAVFGLMLSPAVYNTSRFAASIEPWMKAADDFGFSELSAAIAGIDCVAEFANHDSVTPPEENAGYCKAIAAHFASEIDPLVEAERQRSLR